MLSFVSYLIVWGLLQPFAPSDETIAYWGYGTFAGTIVLSVFIVELTIKMVRKKKRHGERKPIWKKDTEWWELKTNILGRGVVVNFHSDNNNYDKVFEFVKGKIAELEKGDSTQRKFLSDELLAIYNEEWNSDSAITEEEFMSRMKMINLVFNPNLSYEVHYEDDNMFLGHVIMLRCNSDGKFTEAVV